MIGRVRIYSAGCAVRVDLENDGVRAWIAERWIAGDTHRAIALSLGLASAPSIGSRLAQFLLKYCPETRSTEPYADRAYYGRGRPAPICDDRKLALREAVSRFRALNALPSHQGERQ
jgi:hypothetical protein